ncbi:sensor domain-containing diguanylate cyclase [Stratiformator vulcanicus]|uniref:diguanylate cyclase n=1 Tax=Stratiformator vulcanicus TaxID=2527980 RepID=A0A517R538_9PLAN|nr:GGDEF domain-containing protein [Stratiformator vulcanicus]QDT39005.1 Diguanylate cyclase DosC [Stratiformator vulcanicus]
MVDPQKIWSSSQLPTLPAVAVRLLDLSKNPDAEVNDFIEIIRTDPAISAKILKATNSSYFGFQSNVTTIDRAVPLLGTTVVTSLALSFSLVEAAMTTGPMVEHYRDYWMQSVIQAATAELLATKTPGSLGSEFFLAGLLCDLGRLAMLKTVPDESRQAIETARERGLDLFATENEMVGVNHVEVGLKLMESWTLPPATILAARHHHDPLELIQQHESANDSDLIHATAVASSVGDYFCGANKGQALDRLRVLTAAFYDLDETELEAFLSEAKEKIDSVGELFALNTEGLGDPHELMAQASEHLTQLALRQQAAAAEAVARQQKLEEQTRLLESKNKELTQQAIRDPLTKLYNRAFFDESLQRELDRCARAAATIGVMFTDIDKFKVLNDTYGHQFGDQVLKQAAGLLGGSIRKSDVLARYGGEEFVVLVAAPTEKGIAKVAERIRAAMEAAKFVFEGEDVPVTISVGAALAIPQRDTAELAEKLISEADEAMYDSKKNGRNQCHVRVLLSDAERVLMQKTTARRFSRWLVNRGVFDIPTVSKALVNFECPHVKIGDLAVRRTVLNSMEVDQILEQQQSSGKRFGEIAMQLELLTEDQVADLLAWQSECPQTLAVELVKKGLLERQAATMLLKTYIAEAPAPRENAMA